MSDENDPIFGTPPGDWGEPPASWALPYALPALDPQQPGQVEPIPTDPGPTLQAPAPYFQPAFVPNPPYNPPPGLPLGPPMGGMPPPFDVGPWIKAGGIGAILGMFGFQGSTVIGPEPAPGFYGLSPGFPELQSTPINPNDPDA